MMPYAWSGVSQKNITENLLMKKLGIKLEKRGEEKGR